MSTFSLQRVQSSPFSSQSETSDTMKLEDLTSLVGSNVLLPSSRLSPPQPIADIKKVTLLNLPPRAWEKIAVFCDLMAVLNLLHVCQGNHELKESISHELDKSLLKRDDLENLSWIKFNQILEKYALLVKRLTISERFKKLEELKRVIEKCPNLKNLNITSFHHQDFFRLPCRLISFSGYTRYFSDQIIKMLPISLQELKLSCFALDDQSNFNKLKELKNLKKITLRIDAFFGLEKFKQFLLNLPPNLSILHLTTTIHLTENEFMLLPHSLKELILLLPNTFLTQRHTDCLPKTLEKLMINGREIVSHLLP
jgi:hypothetical protein